MIAKNLARIVATSKNVPGRDWSPVWIPYNKVVDRLTSISFHSNAAQFKEPSNNDPETSWNTGKTLLIRASFSNWYDDGNSQEKHHNANLRFILNSSSEDANNFIRKFQDKTKAPHSKAQVYKVILQSCLEPSKIGFITYSMHTLQVNQLLKKNEGG